MERVHDTPGGEREGDSEREGRKRNGKEMEVEKRSR